MYLYVVLRKDYYFMSDDFQYKICGVFDSIENAEQCIKEWGGEKIAHWEEFGLNKIYAN